MKGESLTYDLANPRPDALIESLRSVGYSLAAALADIIDNSIAAKADNIWINFNWDGGNSSISVLDDGNGMSEAALVDAMRPGSLNPLEIRAPSDLGRFGLGLKTASFSQGRELHVWTKEVGEAEHGRCWDLEYVSLHNEWRLRKDLPIPASDLAKVFNRNQSGTLVTWKKLDRVVPHDTEVADNEAHKFFMARIKDVRQHLSMIFHRYMANEVAWRTKRLAIFVNGTDQIAAIEAWNPFRGGANAGAQSTPVEHLAFKGLHLAVKGFVMPHRDRLLPEEYERLGGPRGWLAQQGYYVYRNDRILVAGDWLKLGRGSPWQKDEQYKLARLSIDIPNSMDMDWSLDVKKSTARPPNRLIARLTDLAEKVRDDARQAFVHRGKYGPRAQAPKVLSEAPWESVKRGGRLTYRINRNHPLTASVLQRLGPMAAEVEPMIRLIEEGVPVERIWLDKADDKVSHAIPYEGLEEKIIREDIAATFRYLRRRKESVEICRAFLLATSPFDQYPHLVENVIEIGD